MTVTEQLLTLDHILAHGDISSLFQPIISISAGRIVGYKALTRNPSDSALHSPINLLAAARHGGRLDELEMLCREHACRRYRHLQMQGQLFLNASPETCSMHATSLVVSSGCCSNTASPLSRKPMHSQAHARLQRKC